MRGKFNSGKHNFGTSGWVYKLFVLLLLTDVCFLVLHIFFLVDSWTNPHPLPFANFYSIEQDRGFAEFFQYMKEYWCVLLLGFVAVKKRSPLYLSWMLLLLYLLLDDFSQIHEKLGLYLSNSLGLIPILGLRGRDLGELMVSAFVGLVFLSWIGIAYRLGNSVFRKASSYLIMLLLALASFGVLGDLLHVVTPSNLSDMVGILEDGGEMLIMSAITTFIFMLSEQMFEKDSATASPSPFE